MSDLSNKTQNELERLEASLKGAFTHFTKNAARAEAELKDVVEALKNFATSTVEVVQQKTEEVTAKAEEAATVVKEEVKKAAPKKAAKKETKDPVEEPKVEETKVEEKPAE